MSLSGKRWVKPALLVVVFLVFLALPRIGLALFGSTYLVELVVQSMIYGILALSLNLLLGYMGFPPWGTAFTSGSRLRDRDPDRQAPHGSPSRFAPRGPDRDVCRRRVRPLRAPARGVYFLMITLALAMLVWVWPIVGFP